MTMLQLTGICILVGVLVAIASLVVVPRQAQPVRGRFSLSQFLLFAGIAVTACSAVMGAVQVALRLAAGWPAFF
jgi:hypothetical protein